MADIVAVLQFFVLINDAFVWLVIVISSLVHKLMYDISKTLEYNRLLL